MKEQEEQFRIIFEQASEGIFVADTLGRIIDANRAGCKMLGYTKEEITLLTIADILHEDEIERLHSGIEQLISGEEKREKGRFKRKDQSVFSCEISATRLSDGRLQATVRDITEQIAEKESLLRSEERFRLTLDHLLEGCMIIGFDWTYLYVNDAAARNGQNTPENLLGRTMLEMYPGVEKSTVFAHYKRCMEERIPLRFEEPFTFANGTTVWNTFSVEPVPEGIFVLALDITNRKKIEEELWKHEARMKAALHLIKFTVFNQDLELRYTWLFQSQVGFSLEQVKGKTDEDLFPADVARKLTEIKSKVVKSGESARGEFEIEMNNRKAIYELYIEPLHSNEGRITGITGTSFDITERIHAEEEMNQSREKIVQLYRHLSDVREEERAIMAREIHDELGQSLASLKLDLIGIQEDNERQVKLKRKISKAITMVDNSIKTVRKISSALRPQMLDELGLASAIEWLSNDFKKRTGLKCKLDLQEIDEPGGMISISLFRIFQAALTNIMLHSRARSMAVKLAVNNNLLILSVTDDGIGITQEAINSHKSFGIVGMHERTKHINGTFEIHSEINKGTEIRVTVPVPIK
jgi:PAS domain S-box-containing protein